MKYYDCMIVISVNDGKGNRIPKVHRFPNTNEALLYIVNNPQLLMVHIYLLDASFNLVPATIKAKNCKIEIVPVVDNQAAEG